MTLNSMALKALLSEAGAFREGHFVLPDGNHLTSYYNCEKLFQYPALVSRAAESLLDRVLQQDPDFVFTPSISSLVLAFEISRRANSQFVLHALPFTSRDYRFPTGTKLLIVEDVVVTGKSLEHARRWCQARGGEVIAYTALVDRRSTGTSNSGEVDLISGLRDPVKVYAPEGCPACHNDLPAVRVEPNYPQRVG